MQLSTDQEAAFNAILKWSKDYNRPYFVLGGYAGTGKTTILSKIRDAIDVKKVWFCCFTGKATLRLKETFSNFKPLDECTTIHKMLYRPVTDSTGKIIDWEINKGFSNRTKPNLIVVDEASMIPNKIFNDLLDLDIPIIFVGDHFQLPPVGDSFNVMEQTDVALETVHRQALDSAIIRISIDIREGKPIGFQKFDEGVEKVRSVNELKDRVDICEDLGNQFILTDTNKRRVYLNKIMRIKLNFNEPPVVGDRVVCLKNSWQNNPPIMNGMLGCIKSILLKSDEDYYEANIQLDGEETPYHGLISSHQFNAERIYKPDHITNWRDLGDCFDYGYALSVHKAQGSEAKRVFLFGDGRCFRENQQRWLYTAVTRASKELYICGDKI